MVSDNLSIGAVDSDRLVPSQGQGGQAAANERKCRAVTIHSLCPRSECRHAQARMDGAPVSTRDRAVIHRISDFAGRRDT
jgi:hypothetical protein